MLIATNIVTKEEFKFNNAAEAGRILDIDAGNISKVLRKFRNSAGGFNFRNEEFLEEEKIAIVSEEQWKEIPDFEKYYEISNQGRVRSMERVITTKTGYKQLIKTRIMKLRNTQRGYLKIDLSFIGEDFSYSVGRLVAAAFCDNFSNKVEVHHIDHNTHNNNYINLSCLTPEEHRKIHN